MMMNTRRAAEALEEAAGGGAECSMCGDVGLQQELFQCQKCTWRRQHRYCSKLYAREGFREGICDWCLEESSQVDATKQLTDDQQRRYSSQDSGEVMLQRKTKPNLGCPTSPKRYKLLASIYN